MLKVYLAAAFSRKDEICEIAEQLEGLGIEITSRWLKEPAADPRQEDRAAFMAERAKIDLEDIDRADMLVRFSDDLSAPTVPSHLATGSRMGETLWALAHEKIVIVVGGHQCVFDYLSGVVHVQDVDQLKRVLARTSEIYHRLVRNVEEK
jgi:hypothetical protein